MLSARYCTKQLRTVQDSLKLSQCSLQSAGKIQKQTRGITHTVWRAVDKQIGVRFLLFYKSKVQMSQNRGRQAECNLWQLLRTPLQSIMVGGLGLTVRNMKSSPWGKGRQGPGRNMHMHIKGNRNMWIIMKNTVWPNLSLMRLFIWD